MKFERAPWPNEYQSNFSGTCLFCNRRDWCGLPLVTSEHDLHPQASDTCTTLVLRSKQTTPENDLSTLSKAPGPNAQCCAVVPARLVLHACNRPNHNRNEPPTRWQARGNNPGRYRATFQHPLDAEAFARGKPPHAAESEQSRRQAAR